MTKRMEELLSSINEKQVLAKAYNADGKLDEATKTLDEIDELRKAYAVEERLLNSEKANVLSKKDEMTAVNTPEKKDDTKAFADGIKAVVKGTNMTEGTPANGGYTVPEAIETDIKNYKDANFNMLQLVSVRNVNTLEGAKTYKVKGAHKGFTKVGEGTAMADQKNLAFERKTWKVDKYSGYYAVTDELYEDSDANIRAEITKDANEEFIATGNKLVLEAIATKPQVAFASIDELAQAINITLGQAYKASSVIVTNDSGLQHLSNLKDQQGNYLLRNQNNDPMKSVLCIGINVIPVHVLPNSVLANGETNKVPFIVGDLAEAIEVQVRKGLTFEASRGVVGGVSGYENDLTFLKATTRLGKTVIDANAFVNGYITDATVAPGE